MEAPISKECAGSASGQAAESSPAAGTEGLPAGTDADICDTCGARDPQVPTNGLFECRRCEEARDERQSERQGMDREITRYFGGQS